VLKQAAGSALLRDEPLVEGDEPLVQGPGQVPRRASRRSERAGSIGTAGALQAP
jgi:hypothetical protein